MLLMGHSPVRRKGAAASGGGSGNWADRSTAPGVFLAMALDDESAMNLSATPDPLSAPWGMQSMGNGNGGALPEIDATYGALKFTFEQLTGGNPGAFQADACAQDVTNAALRFNEGDTFYIQFQVRYSDSFADQVTLLGTSRYQYVVSNIFTTTSGSDEVLVDIYSITNHAVPAVGQFICFSRVSTIAGLDLNGVFEVITNEPSNKFKIRARAAANASVTSGGGAGICYLYNFVGATATVGMFPADAFSTQAGSSTVTVHWPSHGMNSDPHGFLIAGASTVGGLNLNLGFQKASVVDADHITFTHTQQASATATGGGSTAGWVRAQVSQGLKIFDIVAQDVLVNPGTGYTSSSVYGGSSAKFVGSSDNTKVVTTWGNPGKNMNFYHYYYKPDQQDSGLTNGTVIQTEIPTCTTGSLTGVWMSPGTCQGILLEEWLTITFQCTLGTATTATIGGSSRQIWQNSEMKWWLAREGQPSELIHHYHPGVSGYEHLLRYTNFDASPSDPTGGLYCDMFKLTLFPFWNDRMYVQPVPNPIYVWYRQLIASTNAIADPA